MNNRWFTRDDGSEVYVRVKFQPAEPDVGIMSAYVEEYFLDKGEPPLTEAEEARLCENSVPEIPEPEMGDFI